MNFVDMDWKKLAGQLAGTVTTQRGERGVYATDASVYQQMPVAVAAPRNAADVQTILGFCREQGIPIIGRGGGTSLSGQAIGAGMVLDFSRFMNRILRVDPERQRVTVEPGVVLDDLNAHLSPMGLLFPPDPATASRATIGGMIGNNACGTRSIVFGRTCDSIESLDCWLAHGERLVTQWREPADWERLVTSQPASWEGRLSEIVERHRDALQRQLPNLPRMAAGYSLQYFVDRQRPKSLSDLLVGSEGTLGLVTEATLRLRPLPAATSLVVSAFATVDDALLALPDILQHQPSAVELLDDVLLGEAVRNASTRELSRVLVTGEEIPAAILLVEFFGENQRQADARGEGYCGEARRWPGTSHRLLAGSAAQKEAWEVRRLGLGLISNVPGKAKGIALIEDACIPIPRLPEYNRFVYEQGEQLGLGISTYAHASVGVLHYKVMLDLHEPADRQKMRAMAEACFQKCLEVGGVFSGEHGDGIVRGEFLQRQFGPDVYAAFVEVKRLFDPSSLLNPHRKIDAPPLDRLLRFGDSEGDRQAYLAATARVTSRFRYGEQGNLVGAIEQCNGVGACRKNLKGTMCPSYRATREERDSTRGRANLLRLAISGQLDPPGLANPELHGALDLCLSCKACKSECPNAVDMARLKSEALQVKWDREGVTASARFIGGMPQRLRWGAKFPGLARTLLHVPGVRWLLESWLNLDRRRKLPSPARKSFDNWWKQNQRRGPAHGPVVGLFVDTWNRFLEPQIGIAAVELLWSCGYRVIVPREFDALRTRMSVGLLDDARRRAPGLLRGLQDVGGQGVPLLCLEPSEASALKDDLPDLVEDAALGAAVASRVDLLDDFLAKESEAGRIRLAKRDPNDTRRLLIHAHCHQKALFRPEAIRELLAAAGYEAHLADLGCCGMAGSFGYTHHNVSLQVAQLRFLPALQDAVAKGSAIVATGTSCREQAWDLAEIKAFHWVQLIIGQPAGKA